MTQNLFVGTWKLVSYQVKLENGQVIHPFGENAIGYLIYTDDGYMSVNMMGANRPSFASDDVAMASPEEILAVAKTFSAYCGKYEILEDKVVHYPEVSAVPNWVGMNQERAFKMDGNQLFLTAPSSKINGMSATYSLVWERVSK